MAPKSDPYSLKLTGPGHSFSRQISEELANRAINLVLTGVATAAPAGVSAGGMGNTAGGDGQLTPKRFMVLKKPATNYERVACLAFYLASNRDQPQFNTADLTKLNSEAAGQRIANPSLAVQHATNPYGYFSA